LETTGDHRLTVTGNLGVAIWRGRVDEAGAWLGRDLLRSLTAQCPEGFGLLAVLDRAVQVPTAGARAVFSESLRAASAHLRLSAVVIEGVGFQAAAVRAFCTGVNLVIRPPFAFQIFPTVDAAASWMAAGLPARAGKRLDATEIVAVVRSLRTSPDGVAA
jgi:hypothetical protein